MKVLIAGIDGYLGWPLAQTLASHGHEVSGIDNLLRRHLVERTGSMSVTPIETLSQRRNYFRTRYDRPFPVANIDLRVYDHVRGIYADAQPDAIVYFGEIPSAPYSMMGPHEAIFTQSNNILGTLTTLWAMKEACPEAHLVKLGTMGEYGTPPCEIPEGFFPPGSYWCRDRRPGGRDPQDLSCGTLEDPQDISGLMFPRKAGSWYHQTKVHDTNNVEMACRFWGLRSTDIMQGVVYGTTTEDMDISKEESLTRFDVDHIWGTAINRFVAQAIAGEPITPFGKGYQRRGFLPLRDSMQCIRLILENPPAAGEYRTVNQFEEVYTLTQLAHNVYEAAKRAGLSSEIRNLENPRMEAEEHEYVPVHDILFRLGYQPSSNMETELDAMFNHLLLYKGRIEKLRGVLTPDIHWSGEKRKCVYL